MQCEHSTSLVKEKIIIADLTLSSTQAPILEHACRSTIAAALQLPGILDAGIALYDPDGVLRLDYAERRDNQPSPFDRLLLTKGSVTYQAVQSGQMVYIHDCATEAPHSPATQVGDIDGVMAAPVVVEEQTIGAIVVTTAQRESLTTAHRIAVDALAERLGLRLSHQILQTRHAHLQQLYAALRAGNRLVTGPVRSQDQLYAQTCQICIEKADFALAWIARPDEAGWFRTLAVDGSAQGVVESVRVSSDAERAEGQGSMGQAWRSGEAAYLQAPRDERRYRHWHHALEAHGIDGFAAVPLTATGVSMRCSRSARMRLTTSAMTSACCSRKSALICPRP